MKAITIWQPWASLISCEEKTYETRSWPTKYRGRIAIHAAKKRPPTPWDGVVDDETWRTIYRIRTKHDINMYYESGMVPASFGNYEYNMPFGAIIATADLVNVWRICNHPGVNIDVAKNIEIGAESLTKDKHAPDFGMYIVPSEQELSLGDWTPGRYAWELRNVTPLPVPIPVRGKQGLWNWEPTQEIDGVKIK